jgi:hypothetical protein
LVGISKNTSDKCPFNPTPARKVGFFKSKCDDSGLRLRKGGDDQAMKHCGVLLELSYIVDDQAKKQSESYFDVCCSDRIAEIFTP